MRMDRKIRMLLSERNSRKDVDYNKHSQCSHVFYKRLHNCTNIQLTPAEENTLNKGLKFNLPSFKSDSLQKSKSILMSESTIKTLPTQQLREDARVTIKKSVKQMKNSNALRKENADFEQDRRSIESIRRKLISNNAMITKADKGNTVVIIDKDVYTEKVEKFIEENNITLLKKDPTLKYVKDINRTINESNFLFKHQTSQNFFKPIKAKAPQLNGLPKIHKNDMPIHPVVDYMSAPGYTLAKKLERVIKAGVIFEENYSLKNTQEFIDNTRNIEVSTNCKMSSLEFVNMYTNIPCKCRQHQNSAPKFLSPGAG